MAAAWLGALEMLCVRKEDLRLGMYIQFLEGSWFGHPFWKSKFLLAEQDDLHTLKSSDVESIWVDENKSLAPAIAHLIPNDPSDTATATPSAREKLLAEFARPRTKAAAALPKPKHVDAADEFLAADRFLKNCKVAVGELFAKALSGNGAAAVEDAAKVVNGIAESVERNSDALITLVRVRALDEYSYMHSIAVSALMINLARTLQLPAEYVKQAGTAGLFMDLGKAFLEPELLNKSGAYGEADWVEMRQHPQLGGDAIKSSGDLSKIVADVCLHHHERYDGTGYPSGAKGDEISLFARMAAICDTYDAMVSDRPHRPAHEPAKAVAEMYKLKDCFDENLVTSFVRSVGIYPVGSLVRLDSRMLGCVYAQRPDQLTKPVVRVFYSVRDGVHVPIYEVDLAVEPAPDRIVAWEEPRRWGFSDWETFVLMALRSGPAKRAA